MQNKKSTGLIYTFGAFGGFLFGYDIGIINGALPGIKELWNVDPYLEGLITSVLFIGAMAGAFLMAPLADKYGRRTMIMVSAIVFAIGAIGSAVSPHPTELLISRVILGAAVGGASALVPMYMGEIAPADIRGKISGLNQLMITVGMLISYLINYAFANVHQGWRWMLGGAAVPAIILLLGAFTLPESPRFLLRHGRKDEAQANLLRLRTPAEASTEMAQMEVSLAEHKKPLKIAELFGGKYIYPLLVGCGITLLQQLQGANTIFYYSSQILARIFGGTTGGIISTVGVGVVFVLATIITLMVVDKFNRRTMFMSGSIGMGACLLGTGLAYPAAEENHAWATWTVFGLICLYVVFYAYSWAAVTWIVIGELFPGKIRGIATGIASAVNWFGNILVALFFPVLLQKIGLSSIFYIFTGVCVIGFFFARNVMYETKGKTLEEIETFLDERAASRA